jgi:hypothetical protein
VQSAITNHNTIVLRENPFCKWFNVNTIQSDSRGLVYLYKERGEDFHFALLYDVIVDPVLRAPGARGGEELQDVLGQAEHMEFIHVEVCHTRGHSDRGGPYTRSFKQR